MNSLLWSRPQVQSHSSWLWKSHAAVVPVGTSCLSVLSNTVRWSLSSSRSLRSTFWHYESLGNSVWVCMGGCFQVSSSVLGPKCAVSSVTGSYYLDTVSTKSNGHNLCFCWWQCFGGRVWGLTDQSSQRLESGWPLDWGKKLESGEKCLGA